MGSVVARVAGDVGIGMEPVDPNNQTEVMLNQALTPTANGSPVTRLILASCNSLLTEFHPVIFCLGCLVGRFGVIIVLTFYKNVKFYRLFKI